MKKVIICLIIFPGMLERNSAQSHGYFLIADKYSLQEVWICLRIQHSQLRLIEMLIFLGLGVCYDPRVI